MAPVGLLQLPHAPANAAMVLGEAPRALARLATAVAARR
jgi:hypothetical protein